VDGVEFCGRLIGFNNSYKIKTSDSKAFVKGIRNRDQLCGFSLQY